MTKICGIDGCREGWVGAVFDARDSSLRAHVLTTAELASLASDVAAVDVPMGLTEGGPLRA